VNGVFKATYGWGHPGKKKVDMEYETSTIDIWDLTITMNGINH